MTNLFSGECKYHSRYDWARYQLQKSWLEVNCRLQKFLIRKLCTTALGNLEMHLVDVAKACSQGKCVLKSDRILNQQTIPSRIPSRPASFQLFPPQFASVSYLQRSSTPSIATALISIELNYLRRSYALHLKIMTKNPRWNINKKSWQDVELR